MLSRGKTLRHGLTASLVVAVAALCVPVSAGAYTGEFAKFNYCPVKTAGVVKCIVSVTNGGEIILGKKKTPIVNPVTLQGGYGKQEGEEHVQKFYEPTNGVTLSKTPEAVEGGLLGIVPPEGSPPLVKLLSKYFFENKITGVNATLELAKPASEIRLDTYNLLNESGTALKLPVKVHLENPFLGSSCYIGSSSSPIIWNLTTGTTSPPAGHTPLTGKAGYIEVKEEEELTQINDNELVENDWSAPEANGCGGILSFLVDPVINATVGLPSAAGVNSTVLKNTIDEAAVESVTDH